MVKCISVKIPGDDVPLPPVVQRSPCHDFKHEPLVLSEIALAGVVRRRWSGDGAGALLAPEAEIAPGPFPPPSEIQEVSLDGGRGQKPRGIHVRRNVVSTREIMSRTLYL